ncbi:allantoicase [Irpex rosettiformis]|uniref:Allantoicase n=1 Tax=Irpex rosettiformis TaxID=378272 RepID=A0ACB8UG45_9APHY|nr:allantoicase [Irpex rosettiformis]
MSFERIPLEDFAATFSTSIELSSVALGGQICSVSDEFFAEANHLLHVEPAPSLKGQFGPKGALFSGWETRRHNPTHDWCIMKLGSPGAIVGFDVDTAHFNGNEAPEVSVDALYSTDFTPPTAGDSRWQQILPVVNLGPSSRHLFKITQTSSVNYVRLNMYPDGGIARFRVYGLVTPVFPLEIGTVFDLAHVFSGGRVVYTSDQHFGVGSNLILPGRGKDMGDGWETKRSRQKGHKDWVIIKLGDAGILSHTEIDTAHFKGNFPESCEIHAVYSTELIPNITEENWTPVLSRTKLGPHRQHQFQLENVDAPYTHVRVTIYPDGGLKRVRVFGRRIGNTSQGSAPEGQIVTASVDLGASAIPPSVPSSDATRPPGSVVVPALRLTPEAFAPFGKVIQGYEDLNAVPSPRTTRITGANQGTAVKFHKLALLESSYPSEAQATAGLSVYRCKPIELADSGLWDVKLLERHPATNQAFIPMGGSPVGEAIAKPGQRYLVIVAPTGTDGKPDLDGLRAFIASAAQGVLYNTGTWHHPMAALDRPIDFTCVETQIGNGNSLDCEIMEFDGQEGYYKVQVSASTE